MKGTAKSQPHNHVEWANGFKSNMPDWPTARVAALSHKLLYWAKEARSVLLTIERPDAFVGDYDKAKYSATIVGLMDIIAQADGLESLVEALKPMPPPPGFPKPPGF